MGQLDLNAAFIFSQVVGAGSFRLASAQLGIPKSNVSRKVAELEVKGKGEMSTWFLNSSSLK